MAVLSDDLLFIHIPKTGGRSCQRWLVDNVPGAKLPEEHESPFPIGHIPLRDIETFSGRSPDSFERIVAVIRDPYEQCLSQWLFWRDRYARGHRHMHDMMATVYPDLHHWLQDPSACDFHVWYEERVPGASKTIARDRGYQDFGGYYRYWLETSEGEIPDHLHIVRFENLADGFVEACRPFVSSLPPTPFPHENAGPRRRDTQAYYTDLARALVEDKFRWTFAEGFYKRYEEAAA